MRFNTSHVVIYQLNRYLRELCQKSFNTSHVVIYLQVKIYLLIFMQVSIHLMLLFIDAYLRIYTALGEFQYISCCYLSATGISSFDIGALFQYISCCYLSSVSKG